MLRFFHAPESVRLERNVRFPPLEFAGSAEAKKNGVIPFSHVYVTSASQLSNLVRYGAAGGKFVTLNQRATEQLLAHARSPRNLSFRAEGIVAALESEGILDSREINLAVVNGMGRGYGDNVAGIGALQLLQDVLSAHFDRINIDLLQRNAAIQSVIHQRYPLIRQCRQLPITVREFHGYDAWFDLSDLLSIPQFNELSLYDFFIHALSLQHELGNEQKQGTRIAVAQETVQHIRRAVASRVSPEKRDKPLVLIHPVASTPLRTIPAETLQRLFADEGFGEGWNIVCCVNLERDYPGLVDISDLSADINALIDIVAAMDAVISVGTVVYHLSGNLGIPTMLLPTVQADVASAESLDAVYCHLPPSLREAVSERHMGRDEDELARVRPLWDALTADDINCFLREQLCG